MGWIDDEESWISLLQARNMTSHVYNEEMAVEIYEVIKNNHAQIQTLITELEKY
jgi:nucleotidyltransferase substrate binding protein (TIGR01987 family)